MRFSGSIARYAFRYYLAQFAVVAGVFCLLIFTLDMLETLRRAEGKNVAFGVTLMLSGMKLPSVLLQSLPFAALIGSILAYRRLAHHSELVAMRACGASAWQFVAPAALAAFLVGTTALAVADPLSAAMLKRRDRAEATYFDGDKNVASVLESGLWLKQRKGEGGGKTLIRASRISANSDALYDAAFFMFDADDNFIRRVDAKRASPENGVWRMTGVSTAVPGEKPKKFDRYEAPASISSQHIRESFLRPEHFAFWRLPGFVTILRDSGFPVARHLLHFYASLFSPLFLASMASLGAAFSLAHARGGRGGIYAVIGLGAGFFVYFVNDIFYALGLSGKLPLPLVALAAPALCFSAAAATMLHKEE
ncbi:MAG: LPS export ABC transporter permease LptG [Rickettsiales bacterium]